MAYGLAAAGQVELEFLVAAIEDAPLDEVLNIVAALQPAASTARVLVVETGRLQEEPSARNRLAFVALALGDDRLVRELLAAREDPHPRTAFIVEAGRYLVKLPRLAEMLHGSDEPRFRSGICAALAELREPDAIQNAPSDLLSTLELLYRSAPDGATRSAAGLALRRWNRPLTENIQPRHRATWFVNRFGMTMIRIEPGTFRMGNDGVLFQAHPAHDVTVTRPFYMANREVERNLFHRYINDPDSPVRELETMPDEWVEEMFPVPRGENPMEQVSWFDALEFCNWLSKSEKRMPCYRRGEANRWTCNFEVDGYRLPTEAEWELACRAGSTTRFSFGDDPSLVPFFGWFQENSQARTSPVQTLLPNAWGLFDMHGNVVEWCWDTYQPYMGEATIDPRVERPGRKKVVRGGGYKNELEMPWTGEGGVKQFGSATREFIDADRRFTNLGFRVVCGIRSGEG